MSSGFEKVKHKKAVKHKIARGVANKHNIKNSISGMILSISSE